MLLGLSDDAEVVSEALKPGGAGELGEGAPPPTRPSWPQSGWEEGQF